MEFDKETYKVWKLPHPVMLHWIINPGIAFNELILGQRMPKVILMDKSSNAPFIEKQYIPCPECNALNDGMLWSKSNTFGHWFGYVCPECHGRIPCLWNVTSLILLALTFPIWIWFKIFGEEKWLEKEKGRFAKVVANGLPKTKKNYLLKMSIIFGVLAFAFLVLAKSFYSQLTPGAITFQAVIALGGGLMFSLIMKRFLGSRK